MEEGFTWAELADIHLTYGAANGNSRGAQRMYQERFPNRVCPNRGLFVAIDRRLRETGTLHANRHDTGRRRSVRTPQFDEEVLQHFEDNPSTSTRAVAYELGVDRRHVWNVVHEQQLHPFHPQKVQDLGPDDYPLRVRFARWFLNQTFDQPEFPAITLFTDEAHFTREGIYNTRNHHVWAEENPRATFVHHYQQRFAVNVWAGIVDDHLIGPYLLPPRLNQYNYLVFLEEVLPELLEDIPLPVRRDMWFQHDGAPPHFSLRVRAHLTATFGNRWIGRGGPVDWPPRSPDLTPLDFFLWGYMKDMVYETPVNDEMDLVARIVEAAARIRENPGIFERTRQSLLRRYRLCIESGGRNFEHLL